MSANRPHIDVLIVVPLPQELDALYSVLPSQKDYSEGDFQVSQLHTPSSHITTFLIKLSSMSNASARGACDFVLQRYSVGLIICYGIAGGLNNDLRLADVCISHEIIDLSEGFKVSDDKEALAISLVPRHFYANRSLCTRLAFMCENPVYSDLRNKWQESCFEKFIEIENKNKNELLKFQDQIRPDVQPHFGPIISYGGVVASNTFSDQLKNINRKVLAVETESAGVFEIAQRSHIPAVTIRGVSDFADANKTTLELESNEWIRVLAAHNAAQYIKAQLFNPAIQTFLEDRRSKCVSSDSPGLFSRQSRDPLDVVFEELEKDIEANLRDTCPAYRYKKSGSYLPTPRVSRVRPPGDPEKPSDWSTPQELAEMLEKFDRVTLTLESTYPDRSLPWLVADMVLRTNGTRIYVPLVVPGEMVRPPQFELGSLPRMQEMATLSKNTATPVFIIDDPDIQSSTRAKALIEAANSEPRARFVIIAKKYGAPSIAGPFSDRFNAEQFTIADFSLGALSEFISDNFNYNVSEAAAVATRLNFTFERFKMHAHPTYFAGISPEMLAALIAANRRNDLIQLAVDGALMAIVVSDVSDVRLSRRWRCEFLKEIISRQYVCGENLDDVMAVELARKMAQEKDIELRPVEFVQSFVQSGILEFAEGGVRFPRVYVRDYLMAQYLSENPNVAATYFDFDRIDEDLNVINIYSELGPSVRVVEDIISQIEADVEELMKRPHSMDVLLNNKIEFSSASNFTRFTQRRDLVLKAIEYVGENGTDLTRKQKLLDIRRSVSRLAEQRASNRGDSDREDPPERTTRQEKSDTPKDTTDHIEDGISKTEEDGVSRNKMDIIKEEMLAHFRIGSVVLGSGAEQIETLSKRRLAAGLISLGCRIAEEFSARFGSTDFDRVRESTLRELRDDPRAKKMHPENLKQLERDADDLVHHMEFLFVSSPYRAVLAELCGQADGNVLRKSVRESKVNRSFEQLTRAVWVSEMDAAKASRLLGKHMISIRRSTVLRFVLAEHFVSRVYWAKWKSADRNALLDVAAEIMKDAKEFDKGKIQRSLKREKEKESRK